MHLTVVQPFTIQVGDEQPRSYLKGDKILEQDEIDAVLGNADASRHVVKTSDIMNGSEPQPNADLTKLN